MNSLARFLGGHFGPRLGALGQWLDQGKARRLGIRNTMRLARLYNQILYGRMQRARIRLYQAERERLFRENGNHSAGTLLRRMSEGFLLDTSGTLPHLDRLLEEAARVIAAKGGRQPVDSRYRAYFRNIIELKDLVDCPSFLDFITSNELLSTVCEYLRFIPALSKTLPTGVRFVESGKHLDGLAHLPPRDSQLYHIDFYDSPMVYVIVLLEDCRLEHGPFTFVPATLSQKVSKARDYWSHGKDYRLTDEEVHSLVPKSERHELIYPRGTVLFIDTSKCLHFGARHGEVPRFQMMYALTSVCRTDFSESYMPTFEYPKQGSDSQLRSMVLDRRWHPQS